MVCIELGYKVELMTKRRYLTKLFLSFLFFNKNKI